MEKRTRSANFTIAEREILLEIVKENRNLIENKGTSDVSNREKNIGWSIVEEEFNASSVVTKRSAKCLRKCWENLKKAARKSVAAEKEEIFRTGGGLPKAAVRDTILEGVLSLISPSSRIENNYDCDAPGKPKGRENVTDDILKIEIPTDQAFSDWSCWNPKKLSQRASQPLQFATNGHISSTVSEASDDPLTEHLFVTQAVSTSSPCSTQAAVEGHPPTPIMLLHPSSSIPIPSSSNTTELITTSQSKRSPPLQIRYRMSAWRGRRRPASPTAAAAPPPSPSQSAEEVSRALLQARLDLVELKKKLALEEHEWKKELHREQMLEQKLRNRLLLLEMETSVEDQWHPVQIKEEPQEEQDIDENGPQEEKKEPFTNLEEEEQQEGTEENEEEEVKRPVAVYLPVKVELEQEEEEEEEDEKEVAPVAVFLMSKEEPKEEVEEEDEGPPGFSDASEKKEEISESSGRESTVEGTSSDSQTLVRSTIGQHSREETHHCSICQKSISKERWTGHMKIHSGGKKYECSVCQKRFSEKVTLDVHMRLHTMEKRHVCSVCQTRFTQSGSLARHMRIHTGERPYECSICERNFYNKSNLNTHMLSHTGEKKHHCSVCQRSFSLKKNLVKHTLVHTGERPYPCSVCGKGFIQRGSLVEHMRTHTGETSIHNCSICQKSFTQRGNLNVHMLTHTGERPHSCSICHKSFNQGGNLVRHMRTHTGEKPHTCSICQKSFNRRGHLELHMQTHTSYTSIYP